MQNVPNFRQAAYTLTELIIVVTVLAIVAAIAVPATTSTSTETQLDLAAGKFAAALRFARSEAIRTGVPHGFHDHASVKQLRVYRLDAGTSPPTLVYDVYHPIDKSLYDIDFNLMSVGAVDSINHTIVYRGTCNKDNRIYFDHNGTPWCSDPETVLLEDFEARLSLGTAQATINLDGITGRVTVQ